MPSPILQDKSAKYLEDISVSVPKQSAEEQKVPSKQSSRVSRQSKKNYSQYIAASSHATHQPSKSGDTGEHVVVPNELMQKLRLEEFTSGMHSKTNSYI